MLDDDQQALHVKEQRRKLEDGLLAANKELASFKSQVKVGMLCLTSGRGSLAGVSSVETHLELHQLSMCYCVPAHYVVYAPDIGRQEQDPDC